MKLTLTSASERVVSHSSSLHGVFLTIERLSLTITANGKKIFLKKFIITDYELLPINILVVAFTRICKLKG